MNSARRSLSVGIEVPGNLSTTQAEARLRRSFELEMTTPTGVGVRDIVRRAFGRSSVAGRHMAELQVHDSGGQPVCKLVGRELAEAVA